MGMTDSQFKGFIRFLIKALVNADPEAKNEKLQAVISDLQKTLED